MKGPSYSHLAAWYDRFFPLDPQVVRLVEELNGGQSILDAGCGTGLLAHALVRSGRWVGAFDLDTELISIAQSRPAQPGLHFWRDDLRSFEVPPSAPAPSMITCLGNSLAHLLEESEMADFFVRAKNALSPGGAVLVQTLDYDRLRTHNIWQLPVLEVEGTRFERWYEPENPQRWNFLTRLSGPWGQSEGRFPLRPWGQSELQSAFLQAGFQVAGIWGGFDHQPPGSALPLVMLGLCP